MIIKQAEELVDRISRHIVSMAPHIRNRKTAMLLDESEALIRSMLERIKQLEQTQKVTIVCAAIRGLNGKVYSVPKPGRHHDVIRLMAEQGCPTPVMGLQGFLGSDEVFYTRREAMHIAIKARQLLPRALKLREHSFGLGELYSEDVW